MDGGAGIQSMSAAVTLALSLTTPVCTLGVTLGVTLRAPRPLIGALLALSVALPVPFPLVCVRPRGDPVTGCRCPSLARTDSRAVASASSSPSSSSSSSVACRVVAFTTVCLAPCLTGCAVTVTAILVVAVPSSPTQIALASPTSSVWYASGGGECASPHSCAASVRSIEHT